MDSYRLSTFCSARPVAFIEIVGSPFQVVLCSDLLALYGPILITYLSLRQNLRSLLNVREWGEPEKTVKESLEVCLIKGISLVSTQLRLFLTQVTQLVNVQNRVNVHDMHNMNV